MRNLIETLDSYIVAASKGGPGTMPYSYKRLHASMDNYCDCSKSVSADLSGRPCFCTTVVDKSQNCSNSGIPPTPCRVKHYPYNTENGLFHFNIPGLIPPGGTVRLVMFKDESSVAIDPN